MYTWIMKAGFYLLDKVYQYFVKFRMYAGTTLLPLYVSNSCFKPFTLSSFWRWKWNETTRYIYVCSVTGISIVKFYIKNKKFLGHDPHLSNRDLFIFFPQFFHHWMNKAFTHLTQNIFIPYQYLCRH